MTAQNELTNTLRFSCPSCRAELAVPVSLAGVEGPCPSCCQFIRAPSAEDLPTALVWAPEAAASPVRAAFPEPIPAAESSPSIFPPVREQALRPIPPAVRSREEMQGVVPLLPPDRGFRARLAIPPAEEPLDDSWKDRHRDQHRSSRRVRRAERAAHSFLESRGFRVVRVSLILASGAMLAFLFHYLQNHQWRFPGFGPAVASETPDPASNGNVRPVADDANELMADDDAEIPPASSNIPAPTTNGGRPVAGGQP
jgi:hypothetical protein